MKPTSDIRDEPAYTLAEGARYVQVPSATLRSWTMGRDYPAAGAVVNFAPVIAPAGTAPLRLSFFNLIEAYVLRALRVHHDVKLKELREAIDVAQQKLRIKRLLLSPDLRTHAGQLFLDTYSELVNLNRAGQLAIRLMLEEHLKRVEWDKWSLPVRLYPAMPDFAAARKVVIDARIAFGRPIISRVGVSTSAVVRRINAGEEPGEVAADYGMDASEVGLAILYDQVAA
jgi:uncharacterized protein (DUF433 family)